MKQLYCIAQALVSRDRRYTVIDSERNIVTGLGLTDSFLSLVSLRSNERIMILLDMQIQESLCREILPAL
jgi:hypothetical protein